MCKSYGFDFLISRVHSARGECVCVCEKGAKALNGIISFFDFWCRQRFFGVANYSKGKAYAKID